uniref:Putative ovule protein n=1 Tax=Solanum chacoense TaxID=4108 RepID=A0A0V0H5I1_SOLCH
MGNGFRKLRALKESFRTLCRSVQIISHKLIEIATQAIRAWCTIFVLVRNSHQGLVHYLCPCQMHDL